MTNKLPESWCVYNDGSKLFKDTVIKYLNDKRRISFCYTGSLLGYFYGINKYNNDTCSYHARDFCVTLTIKQFIEMTTEWKPEVGELVEVSDNGTTWNKKIFLHKFPGTKEYPIVCVGGDSEKNFKDGKNYSFMSWKYMRHIEEPQIIELTIEEIAKLKGCKPEQIRIKE